MKKDLIKLFQDEVLANTALAVIESNDIDFIMSFPAAKRRYDECYNPPSINDMKLHILNALLEGYGVESFKIEDVGDDESYCHYVNLGDTYTYTILLYNGDFEVGCWGDVAEKYNYDTNF